MTIGKELKHIEEAQLQDVKNFFFKHYTPRNAVMCVAGNVSTEEIKSLAEKWFEPIDAGNLYERNLPIEPIQTAPRFLELQKDVPVSAIYKAYHIANRLDKNFYATDLITEVMGGGQSSRLYNALVKEQKLFSQIDCYHTGSVDRGLIVVDGKLAPNVKPEEADKAIQIELKKLIDNKITDLELAKVKNKVEAMITFEDVNLLSRANNLAFYELLGDAEKMNQEFANYNAVTVDDIQTEAASIFTINNSNTMYYLAKEVGNY